jgi:glycine dehydrogenase subunit 1
MRYLPQTKNSREAMLKAIGVSSVDDLFKNVPKSAFVKELADLPMHQGELEVERQLSSYANMNHAAPDGPFFLGAGLYYHHLPSTVDYIIQRSEFLTAYTPYQPEIAQGTLTAIFEFQTMIAQLTGQEIANASLYDGATATAEAALMALRILKKRRKVCVGNALNPEYSMVLDTYMGNHDDVEVFQGEPDEDTACVIVQSPDFFGQPHAYDEWRKKCDETGALLIVVVTEIVSLGLLPPPSSADIVCGEAQSVGLPISFGGPHLGFFACREKFVRQMPGRLCGETVDADGKRGFVLTLNTREQHIRRDKATSNICTNQGLCALAFTVHMALLGEDGFKQLAVLNHEAACRLADKLSAIDGISLKTEAFFNEFAITVSKNAHDVVKALAAQNIIAGYAADEQTILLAATEMNTEEDMDALVSAISKALA